MKAILVFLYITVCLLLILFIILQNNKGAQMGASMSQASRSFFGSSGSKGFFYTATKWLIALFFILALSLTAVEFKTQHQQEVKLPFLAKASKTSTEK